MAYHTKCNPLPTRKMTATPGTTKLLTDFLAAGDAVPAEADKAPYTDDLFCNKVVIQADPGNTAGQAIWIGIRKANLAAPTTVDKTNYENVLGKITAGQVFTLQLDDSGNPIRARDILIDADNVANIAFGYMHVR